MTPTPCPSCEEAREQAERLAADLADAHRREDEVAESLERLLAARGPEAPSICAWCGHGAITLEERREHALVCAKSPAVQRALAAESALAEVTRERDEAVAKVGGLHSMISDLRIERDVLATAAPGYESVAREAIADRTSAEEALDASQSRAKELEGALEAVVWCGWSSMSETPCCIECGDYKPRHHEGCAIARALLPGGGK